MSGALWALIMALLGGALLTAGDIVLKFWLSSKSMIEFGFSMIFYNLGILCLIESCKYENIAVASTIFVAFNVVTLVVVTWFYFGERISTMQLIGIALALISIGLLELDKIS